MSAIQIPRIPPVVLGGREYEVQIPRLRVFIMDCGCWTLTDQYFGVLSGSFMAIGTFTAPAEKCEPIFPKKDLTNKLIKELFEQTGARLLATNWGRVLPTRAEDQARAEELLSSKDDLYVFIPDMHLGLIDLADDFARQPHAPAIQTESVRANIMQLLKLLRTAKQLNATIIQLGDMLDIWEAEAELSIYYEDKPQLYDYFTYQKTERKCRDRESRAKLAASRIVQRWKEYCPNEFTELLNSIDLYLLGNHDIELKWLAPRSNQLLTFTAEGQQGDHVKKRWIVEHGHKHDEYNNTDKATSAGSVLRTTQGKAMTYTWARMERGQSLQDTGKFAAIGLEKGQDGMFQNVPLSDPLDNATITAAGVRIVPGSVITGIQNQFSFETMRQNLFIWVQKEFEKANEDGGFQFTKGTSVQGHPYIYWQRREPGPPPRLPFYAYVHAHTHTPSLKALWMWRLGPYAAIETP